MEKDETESKRDQEIYDLRMEAFKCMTAAKVFLSVAGDEDIADGIESMSKSVAVDLLDNDV